MTKQILAPAAQGARRRLNKTPAWKSALLASAIGTVILGWGILGRADSTANNQTPAQDTSALQPLDALMSDSMDDDRGSFSVDSSTIPSMPQAPIFRQAPARTRGS